MLRVLTRASRAAASAVRLAHTLPTLKYPVSGGVAPVISAQQLDFHYNKHHNTYVTNLNKLLAGSPLENKSLTEIMLATHDRPDQVAIFNNAAQHYNHSFFWDCMVPNGSAMPESVTKRLVESFGSVEAFQQAFTTSATTLFGSGWTWLVEDAATKKLRVVNTSNAGNPYTQKLRPLLTLDVWEHSYYLDHQNRRVDYIANWWKAVDWQFVASRLASSQ